MHIAATVNQYNDEIGLIYDSIYELKSQPDMPKDIKEKVKASKKSLEEDNIEDLYDGNMTLLEEIENQLKKSNKI